MVGINSIDHLAFGPDCFEEGKVLSFCFLAFSPSLSKIGNDCKKQQELCEDKNYQSKVNKSQNISLQLLLILLDNLSFAHA